VWLLARVGSDVSGLVLKTMEGLVAERTLVGSRQIRSLIAVRLSSAEHRWHDADSGHFSLLLLLLLGEIGKLLSGLLLLLFESSLGLRIEQI
jgi:hypothetical protein